MEGNTPENTPIIYSDSEKKQPSKAVITIIAVIVIIAAVVGVLLGQRACSEQQHSKYATGESYTVSGHVQTASKETRRSSTDRSRKHTVYKVEIKTVEELPDGTHMFESTDFEDYSKVSKYEKMPNTLVDLTIDEKGYIAKAEKSPENTGDDIDWNDPEDIARFENMSEEEQTEKMYELWRQKNGKE